VPPTATRVVPPTATPVVPPTFTPVVPPTATRVAPPTATPLVQPSATPPCSRNPRKYVVQRGDTLYRIAHRFNTTVFGLQRLNRLWGIWIRPGQKLTIPGGCSPTVLPKPTNDVSERHKGDDQRNPAPTESHSGDDQSKTAQTDNQSGSQWSDTQHRIYYTVKAGDNLFRIGLRYSVSVAALQATNGLRSTYITVGQVLLIP
jgi:membrane-bound lytic murein transglycosylase D